MTKIFTKQDLEEIANIEKGDMQFDFLNNSMDLRQLGTLFGLPLYIDVATIKSSEEKLKKEFIAREVLKRAVGFPK